MPPRHIAIVAAFAVLVAVVLSVPWGAGQSTPLRTSERWLEGSDFISEGGREQMVSSVIEAPHSFTSLGVAWKASPAAEWSHRVSIDGVSWGDWLPLDEDAHGSGSAAKRVGELQFYDDPARFLQVRAHGGDSEIDVDGFHAVFIEPSTPAAEPTFLAASDANPVPKPPVVSRTGWGCPDGQGSRWAPVATDPDFLIVHHSAGSNSSNNWAATVQAIWSFHAITRGWGDVGYNFLIDPNGTIYEGRAGGDSIGAHFSCTNGGTMGVCMIGDYTNIEPTEAALDSLAHLLAWKADLESIDPLGQGLHSQSGLVLNSISGHRDGNPGTQGCASGTVCPGAMLYPLLPELRTRVAEIVSTGTPFPPELGLESYALVGSMAPGEDLDLEITLEHLDGATVTGISAVLSTSSPYLTITDAAKNYPDIVSGDARDEIGDFDFIVAADAPHGHVAQLLLTVTAENGEWDFAINLPPVVAPPQVDLAGVSANPVEVQPGAGTTFSYQIVADRGFAAEFALTLIGAAGDEYSLPVFTTNLNTGSQTKNRGMLLPADIPPGSYGLRVSIGSGGVVVAEETFSDVLVVLSPSYADWAIASIADPGARDVGADPDGDGLANLLEYALLLDPAAPDATPLDFLWFEDGGLRYPAVRFTERSGADVSVMVEVDDGTGAWAGTAVGVESQAVLGGARRAVRSAREVSDDDRQFLRLRVSDGGGS